MRGTIDLHWCLYLRWTILFNNRDSNLSLLLDKIGDFLLLIYVFCKLLVETLLSSIIDEVRLNNSIEIGSFMRWHDLVNLEDIL